jgi:DNA repair protein RecO (recombination protein O)
MITTDRGLVLRVYALRETSAIVSVLGFEAARVRLVAHGARAPRSRLSACLAAGNEIDFVYSLAPGRELGTLRELGLRKAHLAGVDRLAVLGTGWAALELLDRLVPEGATEPGLGEETASLLHDLRRAPDRGTAVLLFYGFELRLLGRLGLRPCLGSCVACGRHAGETGGSVDLGAGAFRCAPCGGRPGAGRVLVSATVGRLLAALESSEPPYAPLADSAARDRRGVGLCLHRLLATHLDRYRIPRALALLKKVDAAASPHPDCGSPAMHG